MYAGMYMLVFDPFRKMLLEPKYDTILKSIQQHKVLQFKGNTRFKF